MRRTAAQLFCSTRQESFSRRGRPRVRAVRFCPQRLKSWSPVSPLPLSEPRPGPPALYVGHVQAQAALTRAAAAAHQAHLAEAGAGLVPVGEGPDGHPMPQRRPRLGLAPAPQGEPAPLGGKRPVGGGGAHARELGPDLARDLQPAEPLRGHQRLGQGRGAAAGPRSSGRIRSAHGTHPISARSPLRGLSGASRRSHRPSFSRSPDQSPPSPPPPWHAARRGKELDPVLAGFFLRDRSLFVLIDYESMRFLDTGRGHYYNSPVYSGGRHEKNISAQCPQEEEDARLQEEDEHQSRAGDHKEEKAQRQKRAQRLTPRCERSGRKGTSRRYFATAGPGNTATSWSPTSRAGRRDPPSAFRSPGSLEGAWSATG